ncbi:MAG: nucleotide exchange factor GrpE [Gammaproteobacteria bacterium]|nr:nucleotide exchange factor GrpE [Gammaproteobacteria bacterium]
MENEDQEPKPEAESEAEKSTGESAVDQVDVSADEDAPEVLTEAQQLEQALARVEENWGLYLRAQADLENMRRRSQKDLANAHKFGIEKLAKELLPVTDSLEAALATTNEYEQFGDGPGRQVVEGLELTLNLLAQAMERGGVTPVDPQGEPFNPEFHEALSMQSDDTVAPNTVLNVVQKGFLLNGRLLRPAMVIVSKGVE